MAEGRQQVRSVKGRVVRGCDRGPAFRLAAILVILAGGAALGIVRIGLLMAPHTSSRVVGAVSNGSAAIAAVAAGLLLSRWRVNGEARLAGIGLALFLLFTLHPVLVDLSGGAGSPSRALAWLDTAVVAAGIGVLSKEIPVAASGVGRHRAWLAVASGGSVAAAAVLIQALHPDPGWVGPALSATGQRPWVGALAGLVYGGLGAILLLASRRPAHRMSIDRWLGASLALWGWADLLAAIGNLHGGALLTASVLHLMSAVALAAGAMESLVAELSRQRAALVATQLSAMADSARYGVLREEQKSRSHDARSALMIVELASSLLERAPRPEDLGESADVAGMLQSGLRQLEDYMKRSPDEPVAISLRQLNSLVSSWARDTGVCLAVVESDDAMVCVTPALVHLAVNAVFVRAVRSGMPLELRSAVEAREARLWIAPDVAAGTDPSGLGQCCARSASDEIADMDLVVLSELLRADGGAPRFDDGPRFTLRLPRVEPTAA